MGIKEKFIQLKKKSACIIFQHEWEIYPYCPEILIFPKYKRVVETCKYCGKQRIQFRIPRRK